MSSAAVAAAPKPGIELDTLIMPSPSTSGDGPRPDKVSPTSKNTLASQNTPALEPSSSQECNPKSRPFSFFRSAKPLATTNTPEQAPISKNVSSAEPPTKLSSFPFSRSTKATTAIDASQQALASEQAASSEPPSQPQASRLGEVDGLPTTTQPPAGA